MRVLVTPDYQTLSQEAAAIVARAIRAKPALTLGLPTGHTPLGLYEQLIRRYQSEKLDFSGVRTFNLDEYIGLPPDDPRSYRSYMSARLFEHINVSPQNTHIPDASSDYEDLIRKAGGIDLLIVGIGANGHIAFNEPGSAFDSRTRIVQLAPETIQRAGSNVPHTAITMGIATILDARKILLLVSGAEKTEVVRRALRGPVSETVPASALQRHSDVIVIMDEAAASAE